MTKARNWDETAFIDVAVQDGVRDAMLTGRAALVFDRKSGELRWANGAAAALFGLAAIGSRAGETKLPAAVETSFRQIRAVLTSLGDAPRTALVRLPSGMTSRLVRCHVRRLPLPGMRGKHALVTAPAREADMSHAECMAMALTGLENDEAGAAIVDAEGRVLASGPRFGAMGLAEASLRTLARTTRGEDDRLVKQIVDGDDEDTAFAMGVGRLGDLPERYLMVAMALARRPAPETDGPEPALAPVAPALAAASGPGAAELLSISVAAGGEQKTDNLESTTNGQIDDATHTVTPDQHGSRSEPARPEPVADSAVAAFEGPDLDAAPIRFVWKTNRDGRFINVSPEFGRAVGPIAADITGRSFAEISADLALDPDGEIAAVFARQDTWSGKSVLWPIQGTELQVPVDLAALPYYSRDRQFEGYRGFGVVRMVDAATDPDARGLTLISPASGDHATPDDVDGQAAEDAALEEPGTGEAQDEAIAESRPDHRDEPPVLAVAPAHPMRRSTDSVVPFRATEADEDAADLAATRHLSDREAEAFRKIGQALGRRAEPEPSTDGTERSDEAFFDDESTDNARVGFVGADAGDEAGPDIDDDADTAQVDVFGSWDDTSGAETRDAAPSGRFDDVEGTEETEARGAKTDEEQGGAQSDGEQTRSTALDENRDHLHGHMLPAATELGASIVDAREVAPAEGLGPDALDGLPLPLLIVRSAEALYANAAFVAMTGDADTGALNARGLDSLFDGAAPVADTDPADRPITLVASDGVPFAARAHLQIVPWMGAHALMFAFEPRPAAIEEAELVAIDGARPDSASGAASDSQSVTAAEVAELRAILDTATDGVILIDADSTIRSLSASAAALFGYSNDEAEGKSFSFLFAHESQRAAMDYLHGLANNGVASVLNEGREVLGRERNGGFLPLFMTIGRMPATNGFCAVIRDITPWKQTEQALQDAKRQAEQASNTKSEFLAKISHEIRTPLNAIIGFSELMAEERFGPIGNVRYRDYLADINKSGRHVLDLVNDLLDISKIEAGKQELEFESVALNDAIGAAIAMVQPQANRNQIIVRSSLETTVPPVVADVRSIKQIVLNLLSNAIRFTHAGGQVIVSTSYTGDGAVLLRIRDSGIGMSEKELESALKPFQQVTAVGRQRGDGTGLGLPLTKALVEANRAEFAISSEPGQGTRVDIVFPPARVLAS